MPVFPKVCIEIILLCTENVDDLYTCIVMMYCILINKIKLSVVTKTYLLINFVCTDLFCLVSYCIELLKRLGTTDFHNNIRGLHLYKIEFSITS